MVGEVLRHVRRVDINPILAVLDQLEFLPANVGSTKPGKSPCWVVLQKHIPASVIDWVHGLELGELRRVLFRKLGPRQGMAPHIDQWMNEESDWHRFQLPLVSHPEIKMRWPEDNIEAHLEPGSLYEVRFDRLHEVVNPTDCERVHLQIDVTYESDL